MSLIELEQLANNSTINLQCCCCCCCCCCFSHLLSSKQSMHCFQLYTCEDLLLFCVSCHCKLNVLLLWTGGQTSSWIILSILWHFIPQTINCSIHTNQLQQKSYSSTNIFFSFEMYLDKTILFYWFSINILTNQLFKDFLVGCSLKFLFLTWSDEHIHVPVGLQNLLAW